METVSGSTPSENATQAIGILDIVEVLAERLWWLLLAPILGAGLGIGTALLLSSTLHKTYTSISYLQLKDEHSKNLLALMQAPVMLDAVLAKHPEAKQTLDAQRQELERKIRFSGPVGDTKRQAGITIMSVDSWEPDRAKSISNMVINLWLAQTKPREQEKVQLEENLARAEEQYRTVSQLTARLEKEATQPLMPGSMNGEVASAIALMLVQRDKHSETVAQLKRALRGLDRSIVVSEPTLPTEVVWPNSSSFAKIGASLAFLAVTALVLIRGLLRQAPTVTRQKVGRIGAAVRLRKKKAASA